jgi:hypothetical protein
MFAQSAVSNLIAKTRKPGPLDIGIESLSVVLEPFSLNRSTGKQRFA